MYLPEALWCEASVTLLVLRREWKNNTHHALDMGSRRPFITDHLEKTGKRVTTPVDKRVSELHDLLSHHHRKNGVST